MSTVKSKKLQVGTDATSSNNFTIYQPATPDGTLRIGVGNADNPTEIAQFTSSGLVSGVSKLDTATGSAPSYSARAWVNFNGTGTVAIRASGNVSSITDNGVGDYTVNFTTAMPDSNYSVVGSASSVISQLIMSSYSAATVIAASARIFISNTTTGGDNALICVAIFR
jgi:hypothetical protein